MELQTSKLILKKGASISSLGQGHSDGGGDGLPVTYSAPALDKSMEAEVQIGRSKKVIHHSADSSHRRAQLWRKRNAVHPMEDRETEINKIQNAWTSDDRNPVQDEVQVPRKKRRPAHLGPPPALRGMHTERDRASSEGDSGASWALDGNELNSSFSSLQKIIPSDELKKYFNNRVSPMKSDYTDNSCTLHSTDLSMFVSGSIPLLEAQPSSREETTGEVVSNENSEMTPAKLASSDIEYQQYIPLALAQDVLAKVVTDMQNMREYHLEMVDQIEGTHRNMECVSQDQYKAYIQTLRKEHNSKVTIYKQVVKTLREEMAKMKEFWEDSANNQLKQNQSLLHENKGLYSQLKLGIFEHKEEKEMSANKFMLRIAREKEKRLLVKREAQEAITRLQNQCAEMVAELESKAEEFTRTNGVYAERVAKLERNVNEKETKMREMMSSASSNRETVTATGDHTKTSDDTGISEHTPTQVAMKGAEEEVERVEVKREEKPEVKMERVEKEKEEVKREEEDVKKEEKKEVEREEKEKVKGDEKETVKGKEEEEECVKEENVREEEVVGIKDIGEEDGKEEGGEKEKERKSENVNEQIDPSPKSNQEKKQNKVQQEKGLNVRETGRTKPSTELSSKQEHDHSKLSNSIIADLKKQKQADIAKIKSLEKEMEKLSKSGGSGDQSHLEERKELKRKEKDLKELGRQHRIARQNLEKIQNQFKSNEEDLLLLRKEHENLLREAKISAESLKKLSEASKEGAEATERLKILEADIEKQKKELKMISENYNSERTLRKKYYNLIEDMKGKIRVYCRARPLSTSEKARNNYSVIENPDEFTLHIKTGRGVKEFQFDQIFTEEHSQERVFEDTKNLVQSAVDGYNVCIFAYGQTGSGKTYTMIGGKEEQRIVSPGIAPRAFHTIFQLVESNSTKFKFKISVYMLELYNDKLLDLFQTHSKDVPPKLDIKKDKKGMVVVHGALTHETDSADALMSLFDKGSKNRHVASTKMNAESSRSHLTIGVVIESTNLTNGTVHRGKLSIVDLAGSERASKSGATAEQLKEAQSINKSLSALGDVISALSSGQEFVPYRNNKLTMLMQDSLGGNAKTLMFVNISPADYNTDETVVSLTYASRVKLITNDASKNADNREIARLKGVIEKMKRGENVDE